MPIVNPHMEKDRVSRRVKFYTLGCKVNQYDTQSIREVFFSRGFKEEKTNAAGVCVINTCTVTSAADQKSLAAVRRALRENPGAKVVVTGCLAEFDAQRIREINNRLIIVKNAQKRYICDILSSGRFSRGKKITAKKYRVLKEPGITFFNGHTRAFLKIQDGCDNFCAYCKVPFVRGSVRSKPLPDIVKEANALVKHGFKEIVLSGICLGSYGRELNDKISLVDVISKLEEIDGLLRIRLSSIEAMDISDELIDKMSVSDKLCPHLHIPLQSGDDEILRKMNRRYTGSFYKKLIVRIKKKVRNVSITTDCLVGFPGEKEENFLNTLRLIKEIMPLKTHVFPYSARECTRAAADFKAMAIRPEIIRRRVKMLDALARDCADNFKKKFSRIYLPVLFESSLGGKGNLWEGYTNNYIKVRFKSKNPLRNKLIVLRPLP